VFCIFTQNNSTVGVGASLSLTPPYSPCLLSPSMVIYHRLLYKNAYRHFCIIVGGSVNTTLCRVLGLKKWYGIFPAPQFPPAYIVLAVLGS